MQKVQDQSPEWKELYYSVAKSYKVNLRKKLTGKRGVDNLTKKLSKTLYNQLSIVCRNKSVKTSQIDTLTILLHYAATSNKKGGECFGVSLNKDKYAKSDYSYAAMTKILTALFDNGYGELFKGNPATYSKGFSKKAGNQYRAHMSCFVMSDKFIDTLNTGYVINKAKPEPTRLSPTEYVELRITLPDGTKGSLPSKKVTGTKLHKDFVKTVNDHLIETSITNKYGVDLVVEYKQVFGETVADYGRFYSTYSNTSQPERHSYIIQGESVVEVDYSSMHPRMLAEMDSVELSKSFYPYLTKNRKSVLKDYSEADHKGIYKVALICMFNSKSPQGVAGSVREGILDKGFEIPKGSSLVKDIIEDLKQHNPYLLKYFGEGSSKLLQRKDSMIAEIIMQRLIKRGIGFLCYHDSFLVPHSARLTLENIMHSAWESVLGSNNNCMVDTKGGDNLTPDPLEYTTFDDVSQVLGLEDIINNYNPDDLF